jgi:hypothetical protein
MLKKLILAIALGMLAYHPCPTHAQQLIESYVALLSEADHFNSSGQRLTSAAAIIRQDRANYHRFGVRDPEDEDDSLFADERNRLAVEQMLEGGHAEPGVISRIVNGTALIKVDVYRGASGPFIRVTLLDHPRAELGFQKPDREANDYTGTFTTQFLYAMCSREDAISRDKCDLYIQGLLYGLNIGKSMQEKGMPVCLPAMTPEAARLRILGFIDGTTGGSPSNNKDGGDWMAFMGVAAGNICK